MNSLTKACFVVPLYAAVSCAVCAAGPVTVILERASNEPPISGVLGYSEDCSFAIYQDRISAIRRDAHGSIPLVNDKGANAIDGSFPLSAYIGNYVLAKGDLSARPEINLGNATVYYSFGRPYRYAQRESVCAPRRSGHILGVEDVMKLDLRLPVPQTASGVLAKEGGFYRLYSDREAATDGAWSYAIDVRFKLEPTVCLGREVIIDGMLDKPRRRTGAVLELADARVVDSTCGEDP